MKILCVGMMVCDTLLATVPSNILSLDSVSIKKPVISCGGDALNVALGLAKLNLNVSLAGRIGNDRNGKYILHECRKNKIDTSGVVFDEEYPTASSFVLIDETGERHFLSEKSIFAGVNGEDISQKLIEEADYVYFGSAMAMYSMNKSGICDLFKRAHESGKITVMDAAVNPDEERNWLEYLAPAFEQTDVFFPSLEEAVIITGRKTAEMIAECFEQFRMKLFGIKLGAKGCYMTDFKHEYYLDCPRGMPVVDTTGAGDSFMAGLICGLTKGWIPERATGFAVSVAAQNVGAVGGTAGIPGFDKALEFYQSWKNK